MITQSQSLLFVVDAQIDFIRSDGALSVPGAEKIVPNLERLVNEASRRGIRVVYSADAHHKGDPELKDSGGPFPDHCMAGSPGQALISEVVLSSGITVIPNSQDFELEQLHPQAWSILIEKDSYNVWDNPHLEHLIEEWRPKEVVVCGVATDYCVKAAVLGFRQREKHIAVSVVTDAIEAVDPVDGKKALEEMVAAGAKLISTEEAFHILQ